MAESRAGPDPSAGTLLGNRYRLDRIIGRGGTSTVWAGVDLVLGRLVAIKVLRSELRSDHEAVERFQQEAVCSARIGHPGVVATYDRIVEDDPAIVMELVEGVSVAEMLRRRAPMDPEEAVRIAAAVADALEAAHRQGVIHRDVSPANMIVCGDGVVKIVDFGIADSGDRNRPATTDASADNTEIGRVGTATFMSPEQVLGDDLDARTDVYSLGVVLYLMLTGRPPFAGTTPAERLAARLTETPPKPRALTGSVPRELSRVVMRAMERNRDQRYGSAAEFRSALLEVSAPTTDASDRPTPAQGLPAVRRRPPQASGRPHSASRVGQPRQPRRHRPRATLRVGAAIVVAGLIAAALLITAALLTPPTATRDNSDSPARQVAEAGALKISSVSSYDPHGTGAPGENDAELPLLIDANHTTSWHTEGYQRVDFGTKSGVGVLVELATPARVDQVVVNSPTNGWAAQVYLLEGNEPLRALPATPEARLWNIDGDATFSLPGETASRVLVWITRLGDAGPRHRVSISELVVRGRSR